MFELSSGVAQPELALDPDGEPKNVCEQQKAIEEDAAPVFVPEQGAPGDEEAQLAHERKGQRQKDHGCDKDRIGQHGNSCSAVQTVPIKNGEATGGGEQPL